MVEQFNHLRGSKQGESSQQEARCHVEITGPIMNYQPGMSVPNPSTIAEKPTDRSPELLHGKKDLESQWKTSPLFTSSEKVTDDEDDVPEIIKRLSQNGLPGGKQYSDTLSSDMIVNSISSGESVPIQ